MHLLTDLPVVLGPCDLQQLAQVIHQVDNELQFECHEACKTHTTFSGESIWVYLAILCASWVRWSVLRI
jgi:hypothetical protein